MADLAPSPRPPQTATIDDESASQMRTLLMIVTVMSNFPLLIVGLGIILLMVLVVLFCRNRQKKVGSAAPAGRCR